MPRYIDADKVMEEIDRIGGHNLCEWETIGVKALIDRQPTADVAPKSEVASTVIDEFADLVTKYVKDRDLYLVCFKNAIAYAKDKLKKKYTEETI